MKRFSNIYTHMQVKHGVGIEEIVNHVLQAWEAATGKKRHWTFQKLVQLYQTLVSLYFGNFFMFGIFI